MKKGEWTKAKPVIDAKTIRLFWTKVDASGGADAGWPWLASTFSESRGATKKAGRGQYGCFSLKFDDGKRRVRHASKVAWALANGRWPEDNELVEHVCDNPPCCNPGHLKAGVHQTNMQDMAKKGRASQGDEHWTRERPKDVLRGASIGNSKLTEEQALIIKVTWKCVEEKVPLGFAKFLGEKFGVSDSMARYIGKGEWWAHLKIPPDIAELASVSLEGVGFEYALDYATALVKDVKFRLQVAADKAHSEGRLEEKERLELTALLS